MDNQHQKIAGYRELSQQEIDLMNECKAVEATCASLIDKLQNYDPASPDERPLDQRFVALAKTSIQTGFMYAVRSVAQPGGW